MIDFVTHNMAPLMFGGMMLFMVIGYPASFSLLPPQAQRRAG